MLLGHNRLILYDWRMCLNFCLGGLNIKYISISKKTSTHSSISCLNRSTWVVYANSLHMLFIIGVRDPCFRSDLLWASPDCNAVSSYRANFICHMYAICQTASHDGNWRRQTDRADVPCDLVEECFLNGSNVDRKSEQFVKIFAETERAANGDVKSVIGLKR